jgi:hypothetical protein
VLNTPGAKFVDLFVEDLILVELTIAKALDDPIAGKGTQSSQSHWPVPPPAAHFRRQA